MTSKMRIRPDNHTIVEFVEGGVLLYDENGVLDNQEDICVYIYDKSIYTDKDKFIEHMSNLWDNSKIAGCW